MTSGRLSVLETSFLYLERPGRPINVGATATFEAAPLVDRRGRLRLDAVREHVESRIVRHPRLRERVAWVPLGLDRPRWVADRGFDIARHVEEVHLPRPGDAALRRVAEQLHAEQLDLDHAPWHLWFVTGIGDARIALVDRAHHALVDGVGGVDLAALVLDVKRDGWRAPPDRPPAAPRQARFLVADALRSRLTEPAGALRSAAGGALRPCATARSAAETARAIASYARYGLLAPRTSIDVPPGSGRRLAWIRADVDTIKAAGGAAGATLNDVVLSAVAGGLRALLIERGEIVAQDLALKALVPVSERRPETSPELGNKVSGIVAPLPIGVADPGERLRIISTAMRELKAEHQPQAANRLMHAFDLLPPTVVRGVVRVLEHQPFFNLIVTNIPGPPCPLWFRGARMLEVFPTVPLAANLSVGVAILSYDGALAISITADREACPDVGVFAGGIESSLDRLGAYRRPAGAKRRPARPARERQRP